MNPQTKLNKTLHEWDKCAAAFQNAVKAAARSHVEWERFAARERLKLKAGTDERLTVADLDALILEKDTGDLRLRAALDDALVTGLRKRLDVFAAQVDACRSEIASERRRRDAWEASPAVWQTVPGKAG